jgi:hypothetical protein
MLWIAQVLETVKIIDMLELYDINPIFSTNINKLIRVWTIRRSAIIRWEPDSILLLRNRFRSVGIGESKIIYMHLYPNRWILVNPFFRITASGDKITASGDKLRDVQVSNFLKLLQIPNGYMQPIASSVLVSNQGPEKCSFEAIKRANP